ncbi:MAG: benzoate-CoA ligase family protein [Myxococcota bacterium]
MSTRFQVPGRPLNLCDVFLDRNIREGRADKIAIIVDDIDAGVSRHTYRQVAALAARYGHALRARGLGLEDRVFIILEDSIDWVGAFFGALKVGCTVMFLNPRISADEVAFYIEDSRCRGMITTQAIASRLPESLDHLKAVIAVDDPSVQSELVRHPSHLENAPTLEEDFAIWLYSSGSTGAPKAAVHRAYDFIYNVERYPKHVLKMTEDDVTVSVPKLFFGYATGSNLLFPFYFGATAVLFSDKPTPDRLFELVHRHEATMLINVPTMIAQMAQLWEAGLAFGQGLGRLRLLTSAGEALPPELYRRWMAGPGIEILDGIGSAEMFHVFISARMGEVKPGSLGRVVDGYEVRIVNPDGQPVTTGEIGTLHVKGDSCAAFYWQRHEKSRNTLQGHWCITSDQFRQDADGHFYFCGRADDMMKIGGRWVSPQEIEDVLTQHSAVAEAGAASFEQTGLVKPMAFVRLRPEYHPSPELGEALSQHVADHLAPFKAPRFVEFVSTLPRGDRDKLDRARLRIMAGEAAARVQEAP